MANKTIKCALCGQDQHASPLIPLGVIRPNVANEIKKVHPTLNADSYICTNDLNVFRNQFVENLLQDEKGELTTLEHDVLNALSKHELLAEHPEFSLTDKATFGEKLSDKIAAFGGSWTFIITFFVILIAWIFLNTILILFGQFDPYPFILLNLILSCIASIQAPIIMMSQNRQEAKDRLRSEYDYRINLKAELEIRHLHEKMDHLLNHQWERLVEIQQVQIEILNELVGSRKAK